MRLRIRGGRTVQAQGNRVADYIEERMNMQDISKADWKLFRERTGLEDGKGVRLDIAK